MDDEKIYFVPGDKVRCRHFVDAPEMYVVEKKTNSFRNKEGESSNVFIGLRCRWFDKNNDVQEAIFSSKDLIKL